tara:strand:+ start:234 stop:389 length:156 start_codon:yes stop_codon:yes gene_type:complete
MKETIKKHAGKKNQQGVEMNRLNKYRLEIAMRITGIMTLVIVLVIKYTPTI